MSETMVPKRGKRAVGRGMTDTAAVSPKSKRPRAGLVLLLLSGAITLYIPVQLYWLAFVPGSFAFTGILFGTLLFACGGIGWMMPQYCRLLGIFGILFSILSLIGALGGLVIGMLLGIVGGCLCFAWRNDPDPKKSKPIDGSEGDGVAV
ncbi:DUF6114 domain-containing protein [Paludifilum halophilum]|uniref:DUF4064 domain-containing protein n=1 Tax=Paludifilum halophilum TaxID=1642702 RepID=A0A235B3Y9_9BACL|nr:DUF6114 domain-containing protein [Paludifilum halophilum]OYD06983.1 hypothetical protein CHM34_13690 [Paludifilum halophilum]